MSVLSEGPPYYSLMVLVIMSWSWWTKNDTTEVDSTVCLSTCVVLDACGASLRGDATFERWLSHWLNSPVFCTCALTLFIMEALYISFSSTVLVSLVMARAILANCSSMDVVSVAITSIIIEKGEVKESERL